MRSSVACVAALLFCVMFAFFSGCMSLRPSVDWASVRMQNNANVKVSWVSIGKKPYKSEFGILGSKGAGKGAAVPVCFSKVFPVNWREGEYARGVDKSYELDLSSLKGCRRITIFYKGNGIWGAKPGDGTADDDR